jgi:phosphate transport system substrate-binding protein
MAVGYVSIGSAVYEAENGTPIRALPLDGIQPTMEAVTTKKFPIIRELNLVVKGQPSPLARDFLAFAQSDRVNDLIKDLFFVPVR